MRNQKKTLSNLIYIKAAVVLVFALFIGMLAISELQDKQETLVNQLLDQELERQKLPSHFFGLFRIKNAHTEVLRKKIKIELAQAKQLQDSSLAKSIDDLISVNASALQKEAVNSKNKKIKSK